MFFSKAHYLALSRYYKYYLFGSVALVMAAIFGHSYLSQKFNTYIIAHTEEAFGSQQLAPQQEDLIRSIAQKMGIPVPLMRKMNLKALRTFGYHNAFAVSPSIFLSQPFLFVSEGFFEDLSLEEQEFIIGHEMIHIREEHTRWLSITMCLLLALLCMGAYILRKKLKRVIHNTLTTSYQKTILNVISVILFGLCLAITGLIRLAYHRHIEWVADIQSMKILKSYEGGIKLLDRSEKELKLPQYNPYWGILSDHPSCSERKTCCIALHNQAKESPCNI